MNFRPFIASTVLLYAYSQGVPISLVSDTSYPFIRSDSNFLFLARNLSSFWENLSQNRRKLRILHIGELHPGIEFQTQAIHTLLYKAWGGGGKGFIFPFQLVGIPSPSEYVSMSEGQWLAAHASWSTSPFPLGATGIGIGTYDPAARWMIQWSPSSGSAAPAGAHLRLMVRTLYPGIRCSVFVNHRLPPITTSLPQGLSVIDLTLPEPLRSLSGSFGWNGGGDSLSYAELHGLFIEEGAAGITWHTIGIKDIHLSQWSRLPYLKESLQLLQPDLIVLDLGRNDLHGTKASLSELRSIMEELLEKLKEACPEAGLLLITPQDFYRAMRPFPLVEETARLLRWIAAHKGAAVWDAYGILGSARDWRLRGLIQPDMFSLTPRGYALRGHMLATALLRTYQLYLADSLPSLEREKATVSLPAEPSLSFAGKAAVTLPPPSSGEGGGTPSTSSPPPLLYHKVKPGETLSEIAHRYGTTVALLQYHNRLRSTRIQAGQILRIPTSGAASSAPPTSRLHIVRPGESLWGIAQKYGTTVDALCRLNKLNARVPLQPGQKLQIP
ncbi:MAG: LysM peptidoglycan-binding domain-containing protein [Bacteroidia bacterium]|nr:LysM peptidoglycan-binding domain-containing protein [Bacteroidia bacterium]MDW8015269.1 LysM peptidoglycan-binding domain-containing protein [Bacteroidia bacterium]